MLTLIERLILEKEIKVGKNLKDKLTKIPTPLAKKLIDFLSSDKIKDDALVDEIDYDTLTSKKNDTNKFIIRFKDKFGNTKERKTKIGKLLKYLGANQEIKDVKGYEMQDLVSYLKNSDHEDIKLLTGEDIRDAYLCEESGKGGLSSSCMSGTVQQKYLDIYVENPDTVKLAVVYGEDGDVEARALLWKMKNGGLYLDRIYSSTDEADTKLKSYGQKIGATLYSNTPPSDVEVIPKDYTYYPYMDTFIYYNSDEGILSADEDDAEYQLQDTGGGSQPVNGVFSHAYGEYLSDDEAVYVEYRDDYFRDDDVTSDYKGEVVLLADAVMIDKGPYEGEYANNEEDAVRDYDGDTILNDEAYIIDIGPYEGEYIHEDDIQTDFADRNFEKENRVYLLRGPYAGSYAHEDLITTDWLDFKHPDHEYDEEVEEYLYEIDYGDYEGEMAVIEDLTKHKDGGYILTREAYELAEDEFIHFGELLDEDSDYYNPEIKEVDVSPKEIDGWESDALEASIVNVIETIEKGYFKEIGLGFIGEGDGKFTLVRYGVNFKNGSFGDNGQHKNFLHLNDDFKAIGAYSEIALPIIEGFVDDKILYAINTILNIKKEAKDVDVKKLSELLTPFTKNGFEIQVVKGLVKKSEKDKRYTELPFKISIPE